MLPLRFPRFDRHARAVPPRSTLLPSRRRHVAPMPAIRAWIPRWAFRTSC